MCYVNGMKLSATYNNESSLTCTVNTGQVSDEEFNMHYINIIMMYMHSL